MLRGLTSLHSASLEGHVCGADKEEASEGLVCVGFEERSVPDGVSWYADTAWAGESKFNDSVFASISYAAIVAVSLTHIHTHALRVIFAPENVSERSFSLSDMSPKWAMQ